MLLLGRWGRPNTISKRKQEDLCAADGKHLCISSYGQGRTEAGGKTTYHLTFIALRDEFLKLLGMPLHGRLFTMQARRACS